MPGQVSDGQRSNATGFYDILDQIVALLHQRGRVTYRALKRKFQLDDDFLEDLKEELIHGQRLAVDENGRVPVWTGKAGVIPGSNQSPLQAAPPPDVQPPLPHPGALPPPAPSLRDAERRQLTVVPLETALCSEAMPPLPRQGDFSYWLYAFLYEKVRELALSTLPACYSRAPASRGNLNER